MKIPLNKLRLPEHELRAQVDDDRVAELADSMAVHGQLQPIGVKQLADGDFEVVFGATRTRAAKLLCWTEIDAALTELQPGASHEGLMLIENVQRANLTPIEEAVGIEKLIQDHGPDLHALRRQTGKSIPWLKQRLELLLLPDDCQKAIQSGALPIGVAVALGSIEHEDTRIYYLNHAIEHGCTTATARSWAASSRFAETGITTMQQSADVVHAMEERSRHVELKANCIVCTDLKPYPQLSCVSVCRGCLDRVRPQHDAAPPIDPAEIRRADVSLPI